MSKKADDGSGCAGCLGFAFVFVVAQLLLLLLASNANYTGDRLTRIEHALKLQAPPGEWEELKARVLYRNHASGDPDWVRNPVMAR